MKVDMSPEAVTARLKTLDELWLLSVKLMNSRKVEIIGLKIEKPVSNETTESAYEKRMQDQNHE
jgi:hypothetical protein